MTIEIGLLILQSVILLRILKAIKGPEILSHRRKRLSLVIQRVKEYVTSVIEYFRSFIRKGN